MSEAIFGLMCLAIVVLGTISIVLLHYESRGIEYDLPVYHSPRTKFCRDFSPETVVYCKRCGSTDMDGACTPQPLKNPYGCKIVLTRRSSPFYPQLWCCTHHRGSVNALRCSYEEIDWDSIINAPKHSGAIHMQTAHAQDMGVSTRR